MRTRTHQEEHFTGSDAVKDVVIGMADGLTVPFALAAGITGAANAAHLVITAGVAEIAAGAIAMGLGGYLAARSEAEHYDSEQCREEWEIRHLPRVEEQEIVEIFAEYGLSAAEVKPLLAGLKRRPEAWRDFMMRFELGLERPHPKRALRSAITIAVSYIVGGAIPLAPYVLLDDALLALPWSAGVTLSALAVFGFVKGHFTGVKRWKSAVQTVLVGSLAASAAFAFTRLLG